MCIYKTHDLSGLLGGRINSEFSHDTLSSQMLKISRILSSRSPTSTHPQMLSSFLVSLVVLRRCVVWFSIEAGLLDSIATRMGNAVGKLREEGEYLNYLLRTT